MLKPLSDIKQEPAYKHMYETIDKFVNDNRFVNRLIKGILKLEISSLAYIDAKTRDVPESRYNLKRPTLFALFVSAAPMLGYTISAMTDMSEEEIKECNNRILPGVKSQSELFYTFFEKNPNYNKDNKHLQ